MSDLKPLKTETGETIVFEQGDGIVFATVEGSDPPVMTRGDTQRHALAAMLTILAARRRKNGRR